MPLHLSFLKFPLERKPECFNFQTGKPHCYVGAFCRMDVLIWPSLFFCDSSSSLLGSPNLLGFLTSHHIYAVTSSKNSLSCCYSFLNTNTVFDHFWSLPHGKTCITYPREINTPMLKNKQTKKPKPWLLYPFVKQPFLPDLHKPPENSLCGILSPCRLLGPENWL